jgi:hypothetical protein
MTSEKLKLARVSEQPVSDDELLADLRRVAEILGASTVSMPKYRELGKFDDSNLAKRFGTWNSALSKAGLTISNEVKTKQRGRESFLASERPSSFVAFRNNLPWQRLSSSQEIPQRLALL